MKNSRIALSALAGLVVVGGWYAFRPERAFIEVSVNEAPPDSSTVVARGAFRPLAHEGRGAATLLRAPDGTLIVRISDLATSHGPDVRVYLLGAPSAQGREELRAAGFVDLGPLKGNVGSQNYTVPPGTNLSEIKSVSVWCRRFGVNFTAAVLQFEPLP
jgi:hypothetical protein